MNNLKTLIDEVCKLKEDEVDLFLFDFFQKKNFKTYNIDELANKNQIKAIKIMFESNKELINRVNDAFEYDPFCQEAMFVYLMMSEDTFLSYRFSSYLKEIDNYPQLDEYEKKSFIRILEFYIDFLLDIRNITCAIKVQRTIMRLTNSSKKDYVNKLAYMYYQIENVDEFYRLYANYEFDIYDFILLILTELKHDNTLIAEQIVLDMLEKIKYATCLDHIWELSDDVKEEKEFVEQVNSCFDYIISVPNFFSFIAEVKDKYDLAKIRFS